MPERRRVRLSPDWGAWPLWLDGDDGHDTATASPDELPLSGGLKERIAAWAARRDSWRATGYEPPSPEDAAAFGTEGRRLLEELRAELGDGYDVSGRAGPMGY